MLYPQNIEEKLGFNKVKTSLKENCIFNLGQQKVDEITFSSSIEKIEVMLNQIVEFSNIIDFEENFPLGIFFDCTKYLNRLRWPSTFIESVELLELKKSLENCKNILSFLKSRNEKYPVLYTLTLNIIVFPELFGWFEQILTKEGNIKDTASKELQNIRKLIREKQSSVSKKMQLVLKNAKSEGIVEEGVSVSIRDGRTVIPVNYTNKRRIKGYIHDESATGKTVFIEPAEIVELNNEIKDLEFADRREVVKILVEFGDKLRPHIDELLIAYDFLGQIDFIRAKTLYAKKTGACKPPLRDEPFIDWKEARHPLLFLAFQKENRNVVPLTIRLQRNKRILVISGPNAGGKSVCLQTIGLLQYMIQCGLLIPVSGKSETGIFKKIFIDIGDEQSIENDLSTYSSHLINMKFFTKNADNQTLFLIDEFGTGTEPMIGGSIAESILEHLNNNKSFGIITTHYTNLKHIASHKEGIENGAMLYDTHKLEPLFQLQIGEPGSSFAFEIARKIGLSEDILNDAAQKIGQNHIDYDKSLKEIIRDKKYWYEKRESIKKKEKMLEQSLTEIENEINNIENEKKKILEQARIEAKYIIDSSNKQIENTISEIRKIQAEKEKTKELRKKIAESQKKFETSSLNEKPELKKKLNKYYTKHKQIYKIKQNSVTDIENKNKNDDFKVGDKVKIKEQNIFGEIIEISDKKAEVLFGHMKTKIPFTNIEQATHNDYINSIKQKSKFKSSNVFNVSAKKLEFKPYIDLRGKRAEDAMQIVKRFIDEAIMVDAKEVRILHGKGNGILRGLIRQYLDIIEITSYRDEHIDHGGSGITVVTI